MMTPPGGFARVKDLLDLRAPWVAALVTLAAGLATMTSYPIGTFNDDGLYLLIAKALAEGQGFVYPHLPGTPSAIHFPPLWPTVLAVAWTVGPVFPENVGWLKVVNPVLSAVAAAGAVTLGRGLFGLPSWAAVGVAVAGMVSVPMLVLTSLLLSEPLFLALLFPTLLVTERLVREKGTRLALAAAGLVIALALTRTIGGVVGVAALLALCSARRWRDALTYGATVAVGLLPWQLFVWMRSSGFPEELRGSYGPYLAWVVDGYRAEGPSLLWATAAKGARDAWGMLGEVVYPYAAGGPREVITSITLGVTLLGVAMLWRAGVARMTLIALGVYLAVALVWPSWILRFVWGLWPLLLIVSAAGLREVARHAGAPMRAGVLAVAALAIVGHEVYTVDGVARGWPARPSTEMAFLGVSLARAVNREPQLKGKRLASELAPLVALYTGEMVLPAEILGPRQHLEPKGVDDLRRELEAIDTRFRPDAYVMTHDGPYLVALRRMRLEFGRSLREVSEPADRIRILLVDQP